MQSDEAASVRASEPIEHSEAFVYHLLALHGAQRTGVMTVRDAAGTVDIYLRNGTPVFAERNTLAGSIANELLQLGTISPEQYEAIVSRMTLELFESEQMRFAEVAVELGFLSHEEVNRYLERQVHVTVVACMASTYADVTFRASDDALGPVASYPCLVQPMVLKGVRQYYDAARTETIWRPDAMSYAMLRASAPDTAALYGLKPDERRYLGTIDGTKTVEQLIVAGSLDVLHAAHIIASLLLTEGISLYAEARMPERPAKVDTPLPKPIESAATRRRMSSPLLKAVRPTAPITVRVSETPAAQTPPSAEAASSGASAPIASQVAEHRKASAERAFAQGKRLFKSDNLPRAARSFAMAARLEPSSSDYSLYALWTQFLQRPPQNPEAALIELRRVATQCVARDKRHAFGFYVLGRVAHARGEADSARTALKIALRLDPDNKDAKAYLRVLSKK